MFQHTVPASSPLRVDMDDSRIRSTFFCFYTATGVNRHTAQIAVEEGRRSEACFFCHSSREKTNTPERNGETLYPSCVATVKAPVTMIHYGVVLKHAKLRSFGSSKESHGRRNHSSCTFLLRESLTNGHPTVKVSCSGSKLRTSIRDSLYLDVQCEVVGGRYSSFQHVVF